MSESRRRPAGRKRTRKSAGEAAGIARGGFMDEALAIAFCALAAFLLVSFLSHEAGRLAGVAEGGESAARNILGPVGHVAATFLAGFMGWCALVPVGWALFLAVYWWKFDERQAAGIDEDISLRRLGGALGGLSLTVLSACTVAAVFFGVEGGGLLGTVVAEPLVRYVNRTGATILMSALLLLALAVVTRRSVVDVVAALLTGTRRLGVFSGVTVPTVVLRLTGALLRSVATGLRQLSVQSGIIQERARESREDAREEHSVPKPRRRTAERRENGASREAAPLGERVEREVASLGDETSGEADEDQLEEPELTRIVVKRRTPPERIEESPRKRRGKPAEQPTDALEQEGERPAPVPYVPPAVSLLAAGEVAAGNEDDAELLEKSRLIEAKLRDFGVLGKVTQVHPGPVITLFEFEPAPGIKVGRIAALQDDLAMSLRASSIRIIAPLPRSGTVGIEVPNKHRDIVRLRDCLESEAFTTAESTLAVPLGKDTYGDPVVVDIAAMPHLLIAGATGTGKSVCINAVLVSLLYRASPEDLGLILIDPKILELSIYEDIPHLRVPVVTVPRQAKAVLDWAVNEMNRRYRLMQRYGVRNIDGYNRVVRGEEEAAGAPTPAPDLIELTEEEVLEGGTVEAPGQSAEPEEARQLEFTEKLEPLPKIVIVIDELADLMLTVGRDIEELITRLAQKARASGIHLILATQRPSVDVITGLIKANFPARLSFRVSSRIDSRTILDSMGAEKLLGRGDMLFMQPGAEALRRMHGAFVSDAEVKRVVDSVKAQSKPRYDERIMAICEKALQEEAAEGSGPKDLLMEEDHDAVYDKAVEFVLERGQASTSMLQRAFRIGYNRAARMIDMMEREGLVGPMDGAKPRNVIVPHPESPEG